jgi:hypothetical protein
VEAKGEANEKKVNVFLRLPVVRHLRAVFELLVMFFWRNYFGDGGYVYPHKEEVALVYDIWYGNEKSRELYIPKDTYRIMRESFFAAIFKRNNLGGYKLTSGYIKPPIKK